jgi:hypothetical protein
MAHDIFISYSNKDKPVADAVVAGLENKGIRCWVAPRDVTPGTSWGQAIVNAIQASKIMVIILSENSNKSRQVVREVERAVSNNVIIIPFRIENIDPTGAMAYYLATEHWLDALTPPLEKHIEKLGNTIELFLTGKDLSGIEEIAGGGRSIASIKTKWFSGRKFFVPFLSIMLISAIAVLLISKLNEKNNAKIAATATLQISVMETSQPETATTTAPPTFIQVGEYRTSRSANGLFVENNMLNLANGGDGLVRLNVSDLTNFLPVDTYQVEDAQEVFVDKDTAYVISGEYGKQLVIIQLGNDEASITYRPESVGGASSLYYVTVQNGLAHLTGHNYWGIIDMQNPLEPKEIFHWEPATNSGNPCNAVIAENIAYIGGGWTGVHIFDISNPENPDLIGQFDTPSWIVGMAIADETLFLTLGEGGLMSVNISEPARPLLMDRIDLPGFASDISIAGDRLYVIYNVTADYEVIESGVIAIDINDTEALDMIATFNDLDTLSDIQVVGDVVFITEEIRGVTALRLDSSN